VITAPRQAQLNSEPPVSTQVVDGALLDAAGIHGVEGLQQLVPGLSVDTPDAFNVLTIRGIGGGGRNIGFDPRAAFYVDGIDMSQAQALGLPLFDVEQVEVLRGPQGHLFGRNTVAGAVCVTTRAPTPVFESSGDGVIGTKGTREANLTLSGPLSDQVLGRVAVASEAHDGFTANAYDGQRLDDLSRLLARARLTFRLSEQQSVSLSVDGARIRQHAINGVPTSDLFGMPLGAGAPSGRVVDFNTRPFENVDLSGLGLSSTREMDGGHVLTLALGHRDTHQVKQQDNDYGPHDLLSTYYVDDFEQDTQEIRVASPAGGRAQYVVGFYHFDERASTNRRAIVGQDVDTVLVNHPLFGGLPFSVIGGVVPGAQVTDSGSVRTRSVAVYGNLDYLLLPSLTLNLGARVTHETKSVLFNLDGSASGNFDIGTLSGYRSSRSDRDLSPSVGATYAVSKEQEIYARYAHAFKSGGWNMDFIDSNAAKNPSFGTETVRSFELGTRGHAFGDRLRYEAAVYSSRFRNFQVFQFVDLGAGGSSIILSNAAKAESDGVDGSVNLRLSRQLELGVSVAWMRAVFQQFDSCSATVDCTGHRLPFAPAFSAALTVGYLLPLSRQVVFGSRERRRDAGHSVARGRRCAAQVCSERVPVGFQFLGPEPLRQADGHAAFPRLPGQPVRADHGSAHAGCRGKIQLLRLGFRTAYHGD